MCSCIVHKCISCIGCLSNNSSKSNKINKPRWQTRPNLGKPNIKEEKCVKHFGHFGQRGQGFT